MNTQTIIHQWLKLICVVVILVSAPALCGCAHYRVISPDEDPLGDYQTVTSNAYFWGALYEPEAVVAECQGQGINDVVVRRNLVHDLISVVTLGVWMPIELQYRCKAPPIDGGAFPDLDDETSDGD